MLFIFLFFLQGANKNTAMPPPSDIVKVAIEWPGANAQLIEMDQVCMSTTNDINPHNASKNLSSSSYYSESFNSVQFYLCSATTTGRLKALYVIM